MAFEWTQEYSVENPLLDSQHQKLFDIINELFDSMTKKAELSKIEAIFASLESYGTEHFAEEEKLMRQASYPHLEAHQKEHADFFERIAQLKNQLRSGEKVYTVPIETLIFIRNWLKQHILHKDKLYAPFLR